MASALLTSLPSPPLALALPPALHMQTLPAPPLSPLTASSSSSSSPMLVIVVSTVVPVCVLAFGFVLVLLLLRWPSRHKGWGRTLAPGVGAQTTLLVTDIQVRRRRGWVLTRMGGEGRGGVG